MSGTVDTQGNVTLDAMPSTIDVNGVAVPVATGDMLCADCLSQGFRRTIAGHNHDNGTKARTKEFCPLCGGKFHGREGKTHLADFACAWLQWQNNIGSGNCPDGTHKGHAVVTVANVAAFSLWLQANPTLSYGKAAQYGAWAQQQQAGTFKGTPAMVSDLDRYLNPKRGAKVGASDPNGPTLPAPSVAPPVCQHIGCTLDAVDIGLCGQHAYEKRQESTVVEPPPVTVRVIKDISESTLVPPVAAPSGDGSIELTPAQRAAVEARLEKLRR